ncbi:MAG: hypothetical protein H0X63_13070 [Flavobacteriales bacterium]|nr:hypothetical protein [Flavobacteriales bacterium]
MKKYAFFVLFTAILFFSCKNDDTPTCIQCSSELTPAFELCKESDGTASVNGENTGVPYNIYLDGLLEEEINCN